MAAAFFSTSGSERWSETRGQRLRQLRVRDVADVTAALAQGGNGRLIVIESGNLQSRARRLRPRGQPDVSETDHNEIEHLELLQGTPAMLDGRLGQHRRTLPATLAPWIVDDGAQLDVRAKMARRRELLAEDGEEVAEPGAP